MATTRKRSSRGLNVPPDIEAALGIGCGINDMSDEHLRELWQQYGERVTQIWLQRSGTEPFVAYIARENGWDTKRPEKSLEADR
jgi:hypothetical protein